MTYEGCTAAREQGCNYRPRVLIVDDDDADLELAEIFLEQLGIIVKTHHLQNDQDLVDLERRIIVKKYDLILSDTLVGRYYGPDEVVKTIRSAEREAGKNVPYFGWSGTPNPEHEQKWREANAQDFLTKPAGMAGYQHIGDRIRNYLGCRCHKP